MTTTKSKPLKSAAQKHKVSKPDTQGINYDLLMKVHKETRESGFSWISYARVKEEYCMRSQTLTDLVNKYGIPTIHNSSQTHPIISLPALEYVLENATILHGTDNGETAQQRLNALKAEAEQEVKDAMRAELENKFQTV